MSRTLINKGIALAVLASAFALAPTSRAEAAFIAYVCNDAACAGGDDVFVQDQNVTSQNLGVDANGTLGFISLTVNNFAGYSVTVNQSQSKPFLANGMDLNYSVSTGANAGGGNIWLYASDTDFGNGPGTASGTLGGTSDNGSVTAIICGGDSNAQLDLAPCTTGTDSVPGISIALADHPITVSTYSLTLGVRVNLAGPGTTATGDFRVNTTPVPEPGSLLLLGTGLFGAARAARRRFART